MSQSVFTVDEKAATIFFSRIYSADVQTVWDYYTKAELLEQWWMPRPWKAQTISQNFTEGGSWKYLGSGPDGPTNYSESVYREINPHRSISVADYFTDEKGVRNEELAAEWLLGFTSVGDATKLTMNLHLKRNEALQQFLDMGFKDGLLQASDQLEQIFISGSGRGQ